MQRPPRAFNRGPGPLVSVFLPTRKRPGWLLQSVDSLISLSMFPSIEFLIRADDDDPDTAKAVQHIKEQVGGYVNIDFEVGPRGNGYADIWKWHNQMARKARGDWILIWNDDAKMATEHWDKKLILSNVNAMWHAVDDVCLQVCRTKGRPFAQEFIFIRRAVVDILGRLCLNTHVDNWMHAVYTLIASAHPLDIEVEHFSHVTEDDTRKDAVLAYRENTVPHLNSVKMIQEKLLDAQRLLNHIRLKMGDKHGP